jgi:uncharacterized protein with HEPN domain
MLDSAVKIKKYTNNQDFDGFIDDEKTIDAVVRNFEIIGEAANRINPDFKMKNPEIRWNRIRGFRNRIVHDYFGIDYEIVWSIIENDLNDLIDRLKNLIESLKKD